MTDPYKSRDEVIADLEPLLVEPLAQLITAFDKPENQRRAAYDAFMVTLAGYYVRGTAQFYNAGVQAERARQSAESQVPEDEA